MAEEKGSILCGIDLGTTNSTIAYMNEHGKAEVIANAEGDRITPSVVLFEENEAVVGKIAKQTAVTAPDRVIQFVKRNIGEEGWTKTFFDNEYTPETISALILKKLVQDAEKGTGKSIDSVVITVPAYFNEVERKATQDAGEIAGLNVISILNEPTAAALAYGMDKMGEKQKALIYDLGGGTFDVTIIEIEGTRIEVLATAGERRLGGLDWDDEIINWVSENFKLEHDLDPRDDPDALQDLRNRAEEAKIALSSVDSVKILCQCQGKTLKLDLTRGEFETMTKGLLEQTETYLGVVLEKAGLQKSDIEALLLTGGSTRMPAVKEMIQRVMELEPDVSINPDECVAMGASFYGAVLKMQEVKDAKEEQGAEDIQLPAEIQDIDDEVLVLLEGVSVTNVNSHSLGIVGIRKSDGQRINHIMIPAQTALPAEKKKAFGTADANQISVDIHVVEGESQDVDDCVEIGKAVISGLPKGRAAEALVDVSYRYGADGRIDVVAVDRDTGQDATVEIIRDSGMSEVEVGKAKDQLAEFVVA